MNSLLHKTTNAVVSILLFGFVSLHALGVPPDIDAESIKTFFDDYLRTQMAENHVAGATVTVVKDDQVLLLKGYGFSNTAEKTPVDPDKTVFALGSLTKVFLWTAVMQLSDSGKLSLDEDINAYLDFKIPATFPQPITLHHLLSHASGFEDIKFDQMTPESTGLVPLGDWLKNHVPKRTRPPGQFSAYGNFGPALAGYIVARVSGLSFEHYIARFILDPLAMTNTSVQQPVPPQSKAQMSQLYLFEKGAFSPHPEFNVLIHPSPAGAIHSTAGDMSRFLRAHLNHGDPAQPRVLAAATLERMHRRSFSHDPYVNGLAHGFWELDQNGQRIIGHAGSHFVFNSLLLLFPDQRLGIFIATNSRGGANFIGENYPAFCQAFTNRFFPRQPASGSGAQNDPVDTAKRVAGTYRLTYNRSDSTPEKLLSLFMSIDVAASADGLIVSLPSGKTHFVATAPFAFQNALTGERLVFHCDPAGNVTDASYDPYPFTALVRSHWYETPRFHLGVLAFCLVGFLATFAGAMRSFLGRKATHPRETLTSAAKLAGTAASFLGLLVLFAAVRSNFDIFSLYTGHTALWNVVRPFTVILAALAIAMPVLCLALWLRRSPSSPSVVGYTFTTLACCVFVWFLYFWNLLGKSF